MELTSGRFVLLPNSDGIKRFTLTLEGTQIGTYPASIAASKKQY